MPKVTFRLEQGGEIDAAAREGEDILETARRAGVAIDAPCSGNGTCGKCRVRLLAGTAEAGPTRHITDEDRDAGWRLACETAVKGDVTVLVPAAASAFRTGIRTADLSDPATHAVFDETQRTLRAAGVMERPAVTTAVFRLDVPTLEDTLPDSERLERAVRARTGAARAQLTLTALRKLAAVLRESDFSVRAVLSRTGDTVRILDVLPGNDTRPVCGLAVDIGTTTVSAALADLETGRLLARASAGNGQIRYGADVINRIIEASRPGGSARLRRAVVQETLLPLLDALCRDAGLSRDRICRVCAAGNTTMSHLLLGLYADPIRMEPFIPSFFVCDPLRASDVLPGLSEAAELILTPNVGSYVGGDITAGVLASSLWNSPELSLFIDLRTNGERVLGNAEYMLCCACSAGPAFEGGDISCGMRATLGAIEAVRIDRATGEPALTVVGPAGTKPQGLCGSGLIDAAAALFRAGLIDARGKFAREGERIRRDEHGMGRYVLARESESADGREIALNEVDLDNFIRAKGAIFSAARLLMKQVGLEPEDLGRIWIAGGIGSGIDFRNAITIGMFPDVPLERFRYIGNSSLSGAYAALLCRDAEEKVTALGRNMMYVELSNEPGYMDEFISACFLPHTDRRLFPSAED